jgi:predicted Fe-Mo cluster-binding NifX family protein
MIIALPLFGSEISPRFDCAGKFLLAQIEEGKIVDLNLVGMEESNLIQRARSLCDRKVSKVICGGIDDFSTRLLNGLGIQVIPWISGDAKRALERFIKEIASPP